MKREQCPVCGNGYRKSLDDHLHRVIDRLSDNLQDTIPPTPGITRCDWNLNTHRITADHRKLLADGWVRAGSVGARVVAQLGRSPRWCHLAIEATTGAPHNYVAESSMGRHQDAKVWWCRGWVYAVANVDKWSLAVRRQVIQEVDARPGLCDLVEAAWRIGGPAGVRSLDVIAPRCCHPGIHPAGCYLALGHAGDHSTDLIE